MDLNGWESQSRFDVVHDASHVMHICLRCVGLVIEHLRVAQGTERRCTQHLHGSGAMTANTAAALQEQHGRLAEIKEMINGSTERKVSGAMTRFHAHWTADLQNRIIERYNRNPSGYPTQGGQRLQAECV